MNRHDTRYHISGHHHIQNTHYYISIQNPTKKSDDVWISPFKLTKNHKDTFFFVNVATGVGEAMTPLIGQLFNMESVVTYPTLRFISDTHSYK